MHIHIYTRALKRRSTHGRCSQCPTAKLCQRFTAKALQSMPYRQALPRSCSRGIAANPLKPRLSSPGFTASARQNSQGLAAKVHLRSGSPDPAANVLQRRLWCPRLTARVLQPRPTGKVAQPRPCSQGRTAIVLFRRPCSQTLAAEAQQPLPYSQALTAPNRLAQALQTGH